MYKYLSVLAHHDSVPWGFEPSPNAAEPGSEYPREASQRRLSGCITPNNKSTKQVISKGNAAERWARSSARDSVDIPEYGLVWYKGGAIGIRMEGMNSSRGVRHKTAVSIIPRWNNQTINMFISIGNGSPRNTLNRPSSSPRQLTSLPSSFVKPRHDAPTQGFPLFCAIFLDS